MATAYLNTTAPRPNVFVAFVIHPVVRVIGIRLLQAIPILLIATFITFALLNLLPGSTASALLGDGASAEQIKALEIKLHLDQPFWERYWTWLTAAFTGNLGESLVNQQSVTAVVLDRLHVSLSLIFLSITLAVSGAIVFATVSAKKPGGVIDRIFTFISSLGQSIPTFVFSLVMVLVFSVTLSLLPAIGYVPFSDSPIGWAQSMILPVLSMSFPIWAIFCRMLRADLIDQASSEDYVQTARAKGAGGWAVLIRHILRNSIFGLITLVGLQMGSLIGNTAIVESIFGLPGIGRELLNAIHFKDIPMVCGIVVVMVIITVLANLAVDLLYAVLDPRIRHDSRS
jgi:peptide/nickel transport system permease protein